MPIHAHTRSRQQLFEGDDQVEQDCQYLPHHHHHHHGHGHYPRHRMCEHVNPRVSLLLRSLTFLFDYHHHHHHQHIPPLTTPSVVVVVALHHRPTSRPRASSPSRASRKSRTSRGKAASPRSRASRRARRSRRRGEQPGRGKVDCWWDVVVDLFNYNSNHL